MVGALSPHLGDTDIILLQEIAGYAVHALRIGLLQRVWHQLKNPKSSKWKFTGSHAECNDKMTALGRGVAAPGGGPELGAWTGELALAVAPRLHGDALFRGQEILAKP